MNQQPNETAGANCSVLIVEDSMDLQTLLAKVLRDDGYLVRCANGGREALRILNSVNDLPKVIMLDLMMADMDGYQFRAAQVKDPRLADIPVIVMTADGNISNKTATLGAQAYLKKPFSCIEDILQTVNRFCQKITPTRKA